MRLLLLRLALATWAVLPAARAARVDTASLERRSWAASNITEGDARSEDSFICPGPCDECCKVPWSFKRAIFSLFFTYSDFRCILSEDTEVDEEAFQGRDCTAPVARWSVPGQLKRICNFVPADNKPKPLPRCTFEPKVKTYQQFLGNRPCSVGGKYLLHLDRHVVGPVINSMFFNRKLCRSKVKQFAQAGMLEEYCRGRPNCLERTTGNFCKRLQQDLNRKRQDAFSMAAWAAATNPLRKVETFPKPKSHPRILRKFALPGWSARSVAREAPEEDEQIETARGAFMCMMAKLQAVPLVDDLTDNENNAYESDSRGKVGGPVVPQDVLWAYFGRFQLYQTPLHFVVPYRELQSDRTLERMVFQGIGAHRLETYSGTGLRGFLNPIGFDGVPTVPRPCSPSLMEALPGPLQANVRFMVHIDGLFDDVPKRPHMGRWGGNAFFSGEGKLLALQYQGVTEVPQGKNWEAFKFFFRSSLVSTVTAFDHLVSTHILTAETLALASIETLPVDHSLRVLLMPFTYGTLNINFQAGNNLFPRRMLVHRASPWADDAFQPEDGRNGALWEKTTLLRYRLFTETYQAYKDFHAELQEELAGGQPPEVPFFEDGKLLHEAVAAYASSYVQELYGTDSRECSKKLRKDESVGRFVSSFFQYSDPATPNFWPNSFRFGGSSCEALIQMLTEFLFLVTGFHRHVGTVFDYFRDTSFVATAWAEGELRARPKHTLLMQLLAATTNAHLPKVMGDMSHLYEDSGKLLGVWRGFHANMTLVQEEIEKRNVERLRKGNLEFHQMEPKHIDHGVMV